MKQIRTASFGLIALGGIWLWAYWPTLAEIAERWATNPMYSHGYLVPVFAAYMLWHRRGMIRGEIVRPSWWGVPWLVVGIVLHLASARFYFDWIGAVSILFVLTGLGIAWGGTKVWRWAWPAIGFLIFMLPLPFQIEVALAYPLQRLVTLASTYVLQTIGFAAIAEGNIIIMGDTRIGVVEACNGLGMLVTFFAMTTAIALLLHRSFLTKAFIVVSAVPIALLANIVRITITGTLAETVGAEAADAFFHGFLGLLMLPLALGMLWIELKVLAALLIEMPANDRLAYRFAGLEPSMRS